VGVHRHGKRTLSQTPEYSSKFKKTQNSRGSRKVGGRGGFGTNRSSTNKEHSVQPRRRPERERPVQRRRERRGEGEGGVFEGIDRMDEIGQMNMMDRIDGIGREQDFDGMCEMEGMRVYRDLGSPISRRGGYANNFHWPACRSDYRRDHFHRDGNNMSPNNLRKVEVPAFSRYTSQYRTKMCMDRQCSSSSCEFAHDRRQMRCSFYWGSKGCQKAGRCAFAHG